MLCRKSLLINDLQLWRRSSVGQSSGIIIDKLVNL
jgi:hypothetical protein